MPNQEKNLDWIDKHLITLLQNNCKATLQEMGQEVGLKPPSVMERIRKLESSGVIRGYYAAVEPRAVGFDITAYIGVSIDYPQEIDGMKELLGDPQILECHHVTGRHTLLLKVRTRNTVELELLIRRIRAIEGVENSETTVVLSTWSERMYVPVESGTEAPEPGIKRKRGGKGDAT